MKVSEKKKFISFVLIKCKTDTIKDIDFKNIQTKKTENKEV